MRLFRADSRRCTCMHLQEKNPAPPSVFFRATAATPSSHESGQLALFATQSHIMGNCCEALAAVLDTKRADYVQIPTTSNDSAANASASPQSHSDQALSSFPHLPMEFHKIYEVGKQLGMGTTSKVYTVRRKKRRSGKYGPNKDLACKIIDKKKLTMGMANADVVPLLTQLRKEVDILRRINHPNIVTYVDFLESKEKIIIITEQLPGGELFDHIVSKGPLSEAFAKDALVCVFSAVAYMHDRGVIHRDIKAENLIFFRHLDGRQSLKMIDFGFSTILKHDLTGSFLGTGGYIAPEIRQHKKYSMSVDNWALGVLLYCALSAKLPFSASVETLPSDTEQCRSHFALRFPPKPWASISQNCKDMITRLLEVDPMQRLTAKDALQHPWVSAAFPFINVFARLTLFSVQFRSMASTAGDGRLKRVVASLNGAIRSAQFSSEGQLSLKRESCVASTSDDENDDDDIHNPYWELPELHSQLRRSMSTFHLEKRSTPRRNSKAGFSGAAPVTTNGGYILGGEDNAKSGGGSVPSTDTSLTSAEAESAIHRFGSHGRQSSRSAIEVHPMALKGLDDTAQAGSFGYDEMHDRIAGDLFYSTYFRKQR